MPQNPIRLALTLTAALLVVTVAAAADSAVPVQEPAPAPAVEAPAAPADTPEGSEAPQCEAAVAATAPILLAAECPTTRCFVDSNCDSFCGGAGFGVCTDGCCFCAG